MRIAIVNDMVIATEAMRRVLLTVAEHQVVWVATNGTEAIAKCAQDTPDLILMDLIMPGIDGVEATRQIMKRSPCAILIVTADVKQNAAKVYEAMSYGALDAVNTPILGSYGNPEITQTLLRKIATIEKLIRKSTPNSSAFRPVRPTLSQLSSSPRPLTSPPLHSSTPLPFYSSTPSLIAIGASTGGPKALATLLAPLPANFASAIVIVQHVDAQFAAGLIDWLDHQTALTVRKAAIGDRPTKGTALVATTDDHLSLQIDRTLTYVKEPTQYPYRPSVDVFFKSLANYWRARGTAILLTGMGRDGAEGLSLLRSQGWYTIAQDEASCVVYGMPRAAVELNAAVAVWNPEEIARHLLNPVLR
ncbi:chemotaxis response regulator protein-glutamate methylesterase [Leptolyngbya sp. FACHB-711]|uniref:chemotaxis response regulator protein-glutamate methylesterase n=1 Tax=unclassified Leptolyngbya TaxID=2650499 RepID=UPI0016875EE4|nr:chemotaxis response regulator protein-glutamate methylesterase [Leptolyngbya sp. FACHB-711]MBD1850278.1 chemotaxis response regulator protein-glutamate methylesterase [Cyanobacteria bacterium FACHB-502]MBD2027019.1 chemotaxis response regulator protein-glutamate methylesterase [Leptolyngbya sp. FACHB-711]